MLSPTMRQKTYGNNIQMPQGLGTGQLFTDNIQMSLQIRGDKLWFADK